MPSRKRKRAERHPSGPSADGADLTDSPANRRIVGWRLWVLRLVVLVAGPALLLIGAEAALRGFGYGHPASLFVEADSGDVYVPNWKFGWRFFPRSLSRALSPTSFPVRKAPGTYRIFVLGGSAAQGVPNAAYGFSRVLEVMLRETYPGARFEVINTAMTAINSHVVLPIARECADYEPDLFIVYMGNNEVTGPYGAGTVFADYRSSRTLIRASVLARGTRLGQLLRHTAHSLGAERAHPKKWEGLKMFLANPVAADDPRLVEMYEHFRANLSDISRTAAGAGAKMILSTVVTNLEDCAPFASLHRPDLSETEAARWDSLYAAAAVEEDAGRYAQAIGGYQKAALIDDAYADLHYRLGRCYAAAEQFEEARRHFVRARDLDALRFRADSRINAIIREVAAERRADGVYLVDASNVFETNPGTGHGLVGNEWLYEHVHLNFAGNYLLARAVFERLAPLLPQSIRSLAVSESPPSEEQCARLLVLTGWDRYWMAKDMVSMTARPPFTGQLDHAETQAERVRGMKALEQFASPQATRQAVEAYQKALERRPEDSLLRRNFVVLLAKRGDHEAAVKQCRVILDRFPGFTSTRGALAVSLMKAGRLDEAIAEWHRILAVRTNKAVAYKNLGDVLILKKAYAEAAERYREAIHLDPEYAAAHHNLAAALVRLGQREEAIRHFEEALRIHPTAVDHYNLANTLARLGRDAEAIAHFQQVLAMEPDAPELVAETRKRLRFLQAHEQPGGPP